MLVQVPIVGKGQAVPSYWPRLYRCHLYLPVPLRGFRMRRRPGRQLPESCSLGKFVSPGDF